MPRVPKPKAEKTVRAVGRPAKKGGKGKKKPGGLQYTAFRPYIPRPEGAPGLRPDCIQICSIDPATLNFAVRVERRYLALYDTGYRLYAVEPVLFLKNNASVKIKERPEGVSVYSKISAFLDEYIEVIRECHLIIIERQLTMSLRNTRIGQRALSHLIVRLWSDSVIIEVESCVKGDVLGAPRGCDLKEWSPLEAKRLLGIFGDTRSIKTIDDHTKQDDFGDTVCQLEAFLRLIDSPYAYKETVEIVRAPV